MTKKEVLIGALEKWLERNAMGRWNYCPFLSYTSEAYYRADLCTETIESFNKVRKECCSICAERCPEIPDDACKCPCVALGVTRATRRAKAFLEELKNDSKRGD